MFGFIKKLIAGIFGFLTGLLPGKNKGSGYYLELKDEAAPQTAPAASNGTKVTPSPAPTPAPTANKAAKTKPSEAEPTKAPAATTKPPAETTFAPKYLIPSAATSNGRRRPGANMNAYLDMARQVKTPG
jgi:hypothetical protein